MSRFATALFASVIAMILGYTALMPGPAEAESLSKCLSWKFLNRMNHL